jgi:diadenosine tetraphosphate (Ap4A) HIT family hydrolase
MVSRWIFIMIDFRRSQEAKKQCSFCSDVQIGPRAQVIAQGTRVFLSFPETIDMVSGHCLIVPNEHVLTLLDCDDDEWTEIRNFQKSVIRMFDALNQGKI